MAEDSSTKQTPATIQAYFVIEKETKGALRFAEVDKEGKELDVAGSSVGTIYVRKSALEKAGFKGPKALRITIEQTG